MKKDKKSGIVKGAVILAAAGVICRLLGVVFRIPLSNIVGNYGIGLYQLIFPLYSLLLIISSAGVPVAISKMVARAKENGAPTPECKRILFNSIIFLSVIGSVISALFMIFCRPIANLQGKDEIWILYLAIGPSVFLVCFISAFRGYFQGLSNMLPTAVSQIVEQLFKVGAGLALAVILVKKSVLWAVFGAVLAVSVSELMAAIFLFVFYIVYTKKHARTPHPLPLGILREDAQDPRCAGQGKRSSLQNTQTRAGGRVASGDFTTTPCSLPTAGRVLGVSCKLAGGSTPSSESIVDVPRRCVPDFSIIKQIFLTSLPITAMSIVFPLMLMFDSFFVVNALVGSGVGNATELYGVSSGAVHTLINLPTVIGMAIATALVPAVARYYKDRKFVEVKCKSKFAIWIILAFAVLCAVIYAIFAPLILKILYSGAFKDKPDELATAILLLRIESIAIVLICLSQVMTGILQGVDKAKWPLIALAAGGAVKILFEVLMIGKIGIMAVSIANVGCFAVSVAINALILPKTLSKRV